MGTLEMLARLETKLLARRTLLDESADANGTLSLAEAHALIDVYGSISRELVNIQDLRKRMR